MAKTFYVLICAHVIFHTVWCQLGETCNTVDGGIGNCISIYNCQQYLKLSQDVTGAATQVLRKAHCGFEGNNPKVCCPSPGVQTTSPQRPTSITTISTTTTVSPGIEVSEIPLAEIVGGLPSPSARGVGDTTFKPVVGVDNVKLEETCNTVDGSVGSCISIYNCQPYLKLSQEVTPEAMQVLKNAHCGFENINPKVCCPSPGVQTTSPQRPTSITTISTTTTVSPGIEVSEIPLAEIVGGLPSPSARGVGDTTFKPVVGVDNVKLGETCYTVDGGVGSCISIYNCQRYLKLSQEITPEAVQVLRNAYCGFENINPKVCCPSPGVQTTSSQRPTSITTISTTTTVSPGIEVSEIPLAEIVGGLPSPSARGVGDTTFKPVVGVDNVKLGETCNTVDGGVGSCISIYNCQPYLKLSQEVTPEAMQVLRKAHCGFENINPKVCCPSPGVQTTSPQRPTSITTISTTTTVSPGIEVSEIPLAEIVGGLPSPSARGVGDTTFKPVVGVDNVKLGETCNTVNGDVGSCISIFNCQPYLNLSQKPTAEDTQVLRNAHCGFEGNIPKVCCPATGTTNAAPERSTTTTISEKATSGFIESLPDPPICGSSNATFSRVVGGDKANLGDLPWMTLLGYKNRFGSTDWLCGGSLISSHHVLTAAHCIHNHENDLYVVRLGELDLAREDEGATPYDVLIKQKIKHAEYSATAFTNDIGILILDKDVAFTDLIRPICIPKDSELRSRSFEDYTPLVAGWGQTANNAPSATHLQVAQLQVLSNDFCSQSYAANKEQTIDQRVLCAGYTLGGKDACLGDGGGPLIQPIMTPAEYKTYYFQIGIVANGKKCAEAGFPGIYTRITRFVPWIEEQVIGHISR